MKHYKVLAMGLEAEFDTWEEAQEFSRDGYALSLGTLSYRIVEAEKDDRVTVYTTVVQRMWNGRLRWFPAFGQTPDLAKGFHPASGTAGFSTREDALESLNERITALRRGALFTLEMV